MNQSDPKALFRRSQAREHLENLKEAFEDAKRAQAIEPQNKAITQALERMAISIQQKVGDNLN